MSTQPDRGGHYEVRHKGFEIWKKIELENRLGSYQPSNDISVREKEKMKGRILENIFFRTLLLKVPSIAQQHRHYHEVC